MIITSSYQPYLLHSTHFAQAHHQSFFMLKEKCSCLFLLYYHEKRLPSHPSNRKWHLSIKSIVVTRIKISISSKMGNLDNQTLSNHAVSEILQCSLNQRSHLRMLAVNTKEREKKICEQTLQQDLDE